MESSSFKLSPDVAYIFLVVSFTKRLVPGHEVIQPPVNSINVPYDQRWNQT